MSDTVLAQNCGFWDSIDGDRVYSAEDFNTVFGRFFTNGIHLTSNGAKNNNFKVLTSGMTASVRGGSGFFAGRWFNSLSAEFSIPVNNSASGRIDSVLIQINSATRTGNLVYRTGTPSSSPVQPSINTDPDVVEFRIANLTVPSQATAVSDVADLRESVGWCKPIEYDTGWLDMTVVNQTQVFNSKTPQVRRIGDVFYFRGSVTNVSSGFLCKREDLCPSADGRYGSVTLYSSPVSVSRNILLTYTTNGYLELTASTSTVATSTEIVIDGSFCA